MDQLWKEFKGELAANRQFKNIDEAVDYAEQWILRALSQESEWKVAEAVTW
jgi:hypothetical protein